MESASRWDSHLCTRALVPDGRPAPLLNRGRILSGERTTLADAPYFSFACEATNPGNSPLMFVGYRPDSFEQPIPEGSISPIYIIQFQRDGKWKEHPMGWCGTGMDGIELPAAKPQKFSFAVPADLAGKEVRVGIRWTPPRDFDTALPEHFTTSWSEPFVLADIDKPK